MKEGQRFFILINNTARKKSSSYICVSLKDKEGKIIEEIEEHALLSDKNFRDLSGLCIGLTRAERLGAKKILVLTNNVLLASVIQNGEKEDYGFSPDIKRLISNFEELGVRVVC